MTNDYKITDIPVQRRSMYDTDTVGVSGKYGLFSLWGEEITPAIYDSLDICEDGYLVVAYKGEEQSLIDYHGNILKKNLKVVKRIVKRYQVLDEWNRMFFVDTEGNVSVDYRFPRMSVDDELFDITPFFIPDEYKDLRLPSNEQRFYDSGDYYQLPKDWIIARKKKKYGVIAILNDYRIKPVLPFEYDKITGVVLFTEHYLLLEKKGLMCYYPLSSEPRYKELGPFHYHFARFLLPDGRQGWLDREGNEYVD